MYFNLYDSIKKLFVDSLKANKNLAALLFQCKISVVPSEEGVVLTLNLPKFTDPSLEELLLEDLVRYIADIERKVVEVDKDLTGGSIRRIEINPVGDTTPLSWKVGKAQYFKHSKHLQILGQTMKQLSGLIDLISAPAKVVHSDNESDGFKVVSIRTEWAERFFTHPENILDQPVSSFPSEISEKRDFYLRRVISSGGRIDYDYEMRWDDGDPRNPIDWRINVSLVYLHGSDVVLAVIQDPEDDQGLSQKNFWASRRLRLLHNS